MKTMKKKKIKKKRIDIERKKKEMIDRYNH